MHEFSVVSSIIDIAEEAINKHGGFQIKKIDLEIGELAGIEMNALDFAWKSGTKNSVLANAKLEIHRMPGKARCVECDNEFETSNIFSTCPNCDSLFNEIISGKQMKVKSMEIDQVKL